MKEEFQIKVEPIKWLAIALFIWSIIFLLSFIASKIENTGLYIFSIWLFSLVVGVAQHHLAFLGHDGSHGLVTKNKQINNLLTNLFVCVPLLVHLGNYKKFHDDHHIYVGSKDDTELPLKEFTREKYVSPQKTSALLLNCFKDLFMGGILEIKFFIVFMTKGKVFEAFGSAAIWWFIVGSFLYLSGILVEFLLIWFIGLFTMFWASFRLRIYFEHYGLDMLSKNKGDGVTHRMEYAKSLGWFRLLAMYWGQFHWEHHHNPGVPIYQLAEYRSFLIKQKIGPEIITITNPIKFLDSINEAGSIVNA
jgi:fatty acid desaturase